jgi:GxxExxY protein
LGENLFDKKMEDRKMGRNRSWSFIASLLSPAFSFFCPPFPVKKMPIILPPQMRRLSQQEFGDIAYEVMGHVFAMHKDLGRFFDENIYKRELARRMPDVKLDAPVDVAYDTFLKRYYLDVLIGPGAVFEFKAVNALAAQHRAQLLNYLLLCNLAHGKLINMRPEAVEHEFVNVHSSQEARRQFSICRERWRTIPGTENLVDIVVGLVREFGTGLSVALYEEAVAHFYGGLEQIESPLEVTSRGQLLGYQCLHIIAPGVALKMTMFGDSLAAFQTHAQRLLEHCELEAIAWVNIAPQQIAFVALTKNNAKHLPNPGALPVPST